MKVHTDYRDGCYYLYAWVSDDRPWVEISDETWAAYQAHQKEARAWDETIAALESTDAYQAAVKESWARYEALMKAEDAKPFVTRIIPEHMLK